MTENLKLQKNINLSYFMVFLANSYFWYAPWLLFLLKFISLPEAATLQAIGILTATIAEIPTGALSDLIGKKKTLAAAFFIASFGEIYMAFSTEYQQFAISYILIGIGLSLFSGTFEAFSYDTLLSHGREKLYKKVLSRTNAYMNAGIALGSLVGGYLFGIWIGLPFLVTAVFKLVGFIAAFFIDEPDIDSEKFSWPTFIKQGKKGFLHLFDEKMRQLTALLLTFGVFVAITYHIVDDIAVIDFGYTAVGIGILYASMTLIAIPTSLFYEKISTKISPLKLFIIGFFPLIVGYIFSPWISVYVWTALFIVRVVYSAIRDNAMLELLNRNTSSNIRATTLSTYSMIKNIPFILLAGYLGTLIENFGLKSFASVYVGILLVVAVPQMVLILKNPTYTSS